MVDTTDDGSSSAPASANGTWPPKASSLPTWRSAGRHLAVRHGRQGDIDLIVLATATPDHTFPATAATVQPSSASPPARRSISRRCARASSTRWRGRQLHQGRAGQARPGDRRGDILADHRLDRPRHLRPVRRRRRRRRAGGRRKGQARPPTGASWDPDLRSDGRYRDQLYVDGGPSSTQTSAYLRMEGKEVFRHAVVNIAPSWRNASATGHQRPRTSTGSSRTRPTGGFSRARPRSWACGRIESSHRSPARQHLGGLHSARPRCRQEDGRIKRGDLVLMEAMGGGFTWGATLARY